MPRKLCGRERRRARKSPNVASAAVVKMLEGRRAAEASRAHLAHLQAVRERQRAEQHAGNEAVARYRTEKAMSDERNAGKIAETMAAVRRAIQRADAEAVENGRGGRPRKGAKGEAAKLGHKRGRGIFVTPRQHDPVNALCDALGTPWFGGAT